MSKRFARCSNYGTQSKCDICKEAIGRYYGQSDRPGWPYQGCQGEATPKVVIVQYTKALADLFDKGDQLLVSFTTKNAAFLEKMELLLF